MLPSLFHSLSSCNAPAASPAWLQCVAGLRALHNALDLAIGAHLQQQHNSSTSTVGASLLPGSNHRLCQSHRYAPLCPGSASHQQQGWRVADCCSARHTARTFASKPVQHEGQQQHPNLEGLQEQQQPQQQQWSQQPPDAADGASLGDLQSHFRKLRSQQPKESRPSFEEELGRLQQQHEQHLLTLAAHQQHQQHQHQQHHQQRHNRLQQQQEQQEQVQQQNIQEWRMWQEGLQEGLEPLLQQQQAQAHQDHRQQQQQGGEGGPQLLQHQHQHHQQRHQQRRQHQQQQEHQEHEGGPAQQPGGEAHPSFQQLGVDRVLLQSLSSLDMLNPTPVQVDAFPAILTGRNCCLQSPTGTGKTLSYLLPLLSRLQPWNSRYRSKFPRVLVVCPTQELCMQVLRVARALLPEGPQCMQPVVGGSSLIKAGQALKRHGPFLLVATPGRLAKLLSTGLQRSLLSKPRQRPPRLSPEQLAAGVVPQQPGGQPDRSVTLVLEEADRLSTMDDFKDLLPVLGLLERETLDALLNPPSLADHMRSILRAYQVVLVSASLRANSLQKAKAWVESNPISICSDASPAVMGPSAAAAAEEEEQQDGEGGAAAAAAGNEGQSQWAQMLPDTITHQVLPYEMIHARSKLGYSRHKPLKRLLQACAREGRRVLIFAPQRVTPLQLKQQLYILLGADYKLGMLHGGQKGQHRAAALEKFNTGKLHALVTTDAFGLGIDYQGVDLVLCLDEAAPTAQAYVARAGRTGRMGRPGTVLTLLPRDKLARFRDQVKRVTKAVQVMQLHPTAPGEYVLREAQQQRSNGS